MYHFSLGVEFSCPTSRCLPLKPDIVDILLACIFTNSGDYVSFSFQHLHQDMVNVNPLYTNGFFLLVLYKQLWIVHGTYLGVSRYDLKKNVFFCLKIFFTITVCKSTC